MIASHCGHFYLPLRNKTRDIPRFGVSFGFFQIHTVSYNIMKKCLYIYFCRCFGAVILAFRQVPGNFLPCRRFFEKSGRGQAGCGRFFVCRTWRRFRRAFSLRFFSFRFIFSLAPSPPPLKLRRTSAASKLRKKEYLKYLSTRLLTANNLFPKLIPIP